jgi:prolyl-tRNA synthetase
LSGVSVAERITKRNVDYSRWYTDIIIQGKLADYSPVKGCMVIRPNGYALWEKIQGYLDKMFKDTGHVNAYFPLFIPESFMKKEAEHVEGFSPECAVVTIGGGAELEEKLYIRPTSETIIWSMYKKWIMSYRDLPILINQWANVVRWEMRTRLFLRTTEFLWQEGHTAHATYEEAEEETRKILDIYRRFAEEYLAISVLVGKKSEAEKFAGALHTYCIEAMMQDRKALQAGTSHNLGQNFAKAFDVKFQDAEGNLQTVWATSWGVSTRLIGALIMAHSDDNGLVLPPKMAVNQAVIIPIWKSEEEKAAVLTFAAAIREDLGKDIRVIIDDREQFKPGYKFAEWELLGIPLRLELGPRDVENKQVVVVRRDTREKSIESSGNLRNKINDLLVVIQRTLLENSRQFREAHTYVTDDYELFKKQIEEQGGFYNMHWCGSADCESKIKDETKATIRVIPFDRKSETARCICCGGTSTGRVIFARSY